MKSFRSVEGFCLWYILKTNYPIKNLRSFKISFSEFILNICKKSLQVFIYLKILSIFVV